MIQKPATRGNNKNKNEYPTKDGLRWIVDDENPFFCVVSF